VDDLYPFTRAIDLQTGQIPDAVTVQTRRLSDLQGLFADRVVESALLAENPVVYRVYEGARNPVAVGQLAYATTVLAPGKVGDEYFMTRGHYHALGDRAEVYYGLIGEGLILLQKPAGEVSVQRMYPGAVVYLPPFWAHRAINPSGSRFAFLSVYPTDAGHDYATIAERGFVALVVERDGNPTLVPNPRFRRS
jgi:glucose-6-phosphate isomerase